MPAKKITLSTDYVLEWLLDRGYVEHTGYAEHPYRIAINEEDYLPYSITFLSNKLSERFSNTKLKSTNRKIWKRELYKCFDEYQIKYLSKGTRGSMYWGFQETTKKYLEKKLGIDLEIIDDYDCNHKSNSHRGGKRWQSYWRGLSRKYSEEDALRFFKVYFDRRMIDPSKNLKMGRKAKRLIIAHNDLSKDVESCELDIPCYRPEIEHCENYL